MTKNSNHSSPEHKRDAYNSLTKEQGPLERRLNGSLSKQGEDVGHSYANWKLIYTDLRAFTRTNNILKYGRHKYKIFRRKYWINFCDLGLFMSIKT